MPYLTAQHVTEISPHHFFCEASTIGLKPGEWPTLLTTCLGNGEHFILSNVERGPDGDIGGMVYEQVLGCVVLTVAND